MSYSFLTRCISQPFLPHTTADYLSTHLEAPCTMTLAGFSGTDTPCPWIPNASYTLIYNLKHGYLLDLAASERIRDITFEQNCSYFSVSFLPGILPSDALKENTELISLLSAQTAFSQRVSCFLDYLRPDVHLCFPNHAVQYMISAIASSNGSASIQQLALELSYSERHIYRIFQSHMGYPPKSFMRILRFQASLQEILKMPGRNNSEFIDLLAYSDQAHFQREFKYFTNMTPRRFIRIVQTWQ